ETVMRKGLVPTLMMAGLVLAACGGGGGDTPAPAPALVGGTPPPPPPPASVAATVLETKVETSDFLRRAGLGPTEARIDALTGKDATDWVSTQIALPPHGFKADLSARLSDEDARFPQVSQQFYETLIGTEAELRARMTFALSQIFVIHGDTVFDEGPALAGWLDILDRNAFGNYRDLMGEVTRSPIMGSYLTYLYNRKGDPERGRAPDENYARELLQLFTIGLVELEMDGTARLGADGKPVDTYTNDDIVGLARVFTGYTLAGSSHRWRDRYDDTWERPMTMYEPDHSPLEKAFLGSAIAAGTQGEASVDRALDIIFDHPNVAPFVSRQLIQRFTASDPRPAYVGRVAQAFETGSFKTGDVSFGTGRRGDLSATLAAILLDPSLHDGKADLREGKVREPVLNYVQFARTFAGANPSLVEAGWNRHADTSDVTNQLSQSPLRSPSVFNFFRPGYVAPGTETGARDLSAPELQIVNSASSVGYMNFMYDAISREDGDYRIIPDYRRELDLADDPNALLDRIDLLLTGGTMSPDTRTAISEAMEALPLRSGDNAARDRLSRVRMAMVMTVVSPEYMTTN
ncbi:MAG: DUF1800 family protein, partial [Litorimonas sp.]